MTVDLKVVSWDGHAINDGANYISGLSGAEWGLPAVQAQTVRRSGAWPLLGALERPGATLTLTVQIVGSNVRQLRDQLLRWFSPEDEQPKRLIVADLDDSTPRYVNAVCTAIQPARGPQSERQFVALLTVVGDVRWRGTASATHSWIVTSSGLTTSVSNPGSDDAYPVITITPTAAKSGGYAYRCFVAVTWRASEGAQRYPVLITLNTQALIIAGKMQSDGDDLRLLVDGSEANRWLSGINTTSTKVWCNLSFAPTVAMTLKTAIPSSSSISSIEVNEDITRMPDAGILLIDSEVFTYTAKDTAALTFTGITRAAKGSAMAAHSAGTTVHWIQREVWLVYGNSAVSAPSADDRYKPAFSLADSYNGAWSYNQLFNDVNLMRSGGWQPIGNITLAGKGGCHTAIHRTLSDGEFSLIGAWLSEQHGNAYGWALTNPVGMVSVYWDGYARRAGDNFLAHCGNWPRGARWWNYHYNPDYPSDPGEWTDWTVTHSFSVSNTIMLAAYFYPEDVEVYLMTVTLNASETPAVTVLSELGNYSLTCTIANETTGEQIALDIVLSLNQSLRIDCDSRTVTYLADNSRQLAALSLPTGQRHWLHLAAGNNTLRYTDSGTIGVSVQITFEARYY